MTSDSLRYWLLPTLFIVAGYFTAGHAAHAIRVLWEGSQSPDANLPVPWATREFGLNPYYRWEVLTIDGKPFTRGDQIQEAIDVRHPGDQIPVTLKSLKGEIKEIQIRVSPAIRPNRRASDIILRVAVSLFLPVFCFVIAFVVAVIRPHDPLAWLLLALLLSFGETVHGFDWDWPFRAPAMLWHISVHDLWPVSMMLFGLYFPHRSKLDRRWPWLK
jgi:phosphoserine phosphatase RsbU/P